MSKPWADMNREELLVEKGLWEGRLQRLNLELKTAKRQAAATKVFLPLEELEALEQTRLRLAAGVRGLQSELTKRGAKQPTRSFAWYFHEEADAVLSDDQYNLIYDRAQARMQAEGAK